MQIIRPDSPDPIAQPRPQPPTSRLMKVIGRLIAILLMAGVVLALGWLRAVWPS